MTEEPRLILPPGVRTANHPDPIRNAAGKPIPCCYSDCTRNADNRYKVAIPHDHPRWRDPVTGLQEMLIYTFCGDPHKDMWIEETRRK